MKRFIVTIILSIIVFLLFFHPITSINDDLGLHLLSGKTIVNTHTVYKTNFFSYTYPHFPYVDAGWLSQVIFYEIVKNFGFMGLLIITSLLAISSILLLYFCIPKNRMSSTITLLFLLIIVILPLAHRTNLRPEIFSFFIMSIFLFVLYRYRYGETKFIYVLPILEVLWVNIHIYFPIGIILVGIFLVDEVFQSFRKKYQNNSKDIILYLLNGRLLVIGIIFIATCLATLLNPYGIQGALYPLTFSQNYGYFSEELNSVFNYLDGRPIVLITQATFEILFIFLLGIFALFRKKTTVVDWLLLIIFGCLGVSHIRLIALFRLAIFIPFLVYFSLLLNGINRYFSLQLRIFLTIFIYLLAIALLLWEAYFVYAIQGGIGSTVNPSSKNAIDFLIRNRINGRIFNSISLGSYLEYRLYPQNKAFVDTRPEAYPVTFFAHEYIPMQQTQKVFEKMESKYGFTTIVFNYTDAYPWSISFVGQIIQNPSWKLVYVDDYTMILIKDIPENKVLIEKFAMDKNHVLISKVDQSDPNSIIHIIGFFERVHWENQEIIWLKKYLQIDTKSCAVLQRFLNLESKNQIVPEGDENYLNLYQQNCQQ